MFAESRCFDPASYAKRLQDRQSQKTGTSIAKTANASRSPVLPTLNQPSPSSLKPPREHNCASYLHKIRRQSYEGTSGDIAPVPSQQEIAPPTASPELDGHNTCLHCRSGLLNAARHECEQYPSMLCLRCIINAPLIHPEHTFKLHSFSTSAAKPGPKSESLSSRERPGTTGPSTSYRKGQPAGKPIPPKVPTNLHCFFCFEDLNGKQRYECQTCSVPLNLCELCHNDHPDGHALTLIIPGERSNCDLDEGRSYKNNIGDSSEDSDFDGENTSFNENTGIDRQTDLDEDLDGDNRLDGNAGLGNNTTSGESYGVSSIASGQPVVHQKKNQPAAIPAHVTLSIPIDAFMTLRNFLNAAAQDMGLSIDASTLTGHQDNKLLDFEPNQVRTNILPRDGVSDINLVGAFIETGTNGKTRASRHPTRRRPWSQEDRQKLRRMKDRGWKDKRIAAALHRSVGAVFQQWRKQQEEFD